MSNARVDVRAGGSEPVRHSRYAVTGATIRDGNPSRDSDTSGTGARAWNTFRQPVMARLARPVKLTVVLAAGCGGLSDPEPAVHGRWTRLVAADFGAAIAGETPGRSSTPLHRRR
jgi:hypothetical protein